MPYRTSSHCGDNSCVEVTPQPDGVTIRDSKTGDTLTFTTDEWQAFLAGVKAGEFDPATTGDQQSSRPRCGFPHDEGRFCDHPAVRVYAVDVHEPQVVADQPQRRVLYACETVADAIEPDWRDKP